MPDNIEKETLSLADLAQYEQELVGYLPEADANASVPPPPKGEYVLKLTFRDKEPEKQWIPKVSNKTTVTHLMTYIECEIVDNPLNPPEFVGRKIRHQVGTWVMPQTGTTSIQAVVQAAGYGVKLLNAPKTNVRLATVLSEVLNAESLVIGDLDWEINKYDKEKAETVFVLRGMNSFPFDPEDPEAKKKNKRTNVYIHKEFGELRGFAVINRFKPLSAAKPNTPTATAAGPDKPAVIPPRPVAPRGPMTRPPTPTPAITPTAVAPAPTTPTA